MVNPGKRMHRLKSLLNLRLGPGAAILPPEITKIHMDFALQRGEGHFGPKIFFRNYLPRLKYWNPSLPMWVNRSTDQSKAAVMTIYFRNAVAAAALSVDPDKPKFIIPVAAQPHSSTSGTCPAPAPEEDERTVTIDMKMAKSDEILAQFLEATRAKLVEPTNEEKSDMLMLEDLERKAAVDRTIMAQFVNDRKRETVMKRQALKDAEAIRLANQ